MEKMIETAIPLHKQIAMGMHEDMYEDSVKMEAKSGKKKTKKSKSAGSKSCRRGY